MGHHLAINRPPLRGLNNELQKLPAALVELRNGNLAQACLRLLGEVGKNHGNMVANMFVAGTRNDHAVAMDFAVVPRRLECQGHFRPGRKTGGAAKFYPVFVEDDRVG